MSEQPERAPCNPGELATIDFEASCLPAYGRSFPVEVGVTCVASGETTSWLIRPSDDWLTWGWDPAAEQMHGISLDEARSRGRPANEVLREMSTAVRGLRVVSDSGMDAIWLGTLSNAARRGVPFEIQPVEPVLLELAMAPYEIESAEAKADHAFPHLHRAGPDARRLAEVIRVLAGFDRFGE